MIGYISCFALNLCPCLFILLRICMSIAVIKEYVPFRNFTLHISHLTQSYGRTTLFFQSHNIASQSAGKKVRKKPMTSTIDDDESSPAIENVLISFKFDATTKIMYLIQYIFVPAQCTVWCSSNHFQEKTIRDLL